MQQTITFPSGQVNYFFHSSFEEIWKTYDKEHTIIITNEHIAKLYANLFKGLKILVIPPAENSKVLDTIGSLSKQLLQLKQREKHSW